MKVLQINTVYGEGSTGLIAKAIHDLCADYQIRCISAHRCVQKGKQPLEDSISISSKWGSRLHGLLSRFTMFKGAGSVIKTARFLKQVSLYAPDVIHLHSSIAGMWGRWAFLNNPCPVFYTPHGFAFLNGRPRWKMVIYRWMERISACRPCRIIACGKQEYQIALKFR